MFRNCSPCRRVGNVPFVKPKVVFAPNGQKLIAFGRFCEQSIVSTPDFLTQIDPLIGVFHRVRVVTMFLHRKIRMWAYACLLITLISTTICRGQDITSQEVKASYILKLKDFVTVDNPPHSVQTVCYYEKLGMEQKESVGQILEKYLEGVSQPADRRIRVRGFQTLRDLSDCDVCYIATSEENNIDNILAHLGSSSILTISSMPRFILRGGMLGFVLDNQNRVKMEANLENLRKRNVRLDAQLLEIMLKVIE